MQAAKIFHESWTRDTLDFRVLYNTLFEIRYGEQPYLIPEKRSEDENQVHNVTKYFRIREVFCCPYHSLSHPSFLISRGAWGRDCF